MENSNILGEQDQKQGIKSATDSIPCFLKEPSPRTSYDHVHFLHEEKVASAVQSNAPAKYNILANEGLCQLNK